MYGKPKRAPQHAKRHYNKRQWVPKKGTKSRLLLIGMLNRKGLTAKEALDAGLAANRTSLRTMVTTFIDMGGWDIRAFPAPGGGVLGHAAVCYRVVGRSRPGGRYRSFNQDELTSS